MQMPHPRTLAIGMFDSGVGGLTVLQQLSKRLPHERFIYFGDTARLPYGDKSSQEILRYSIENADFLMHRHAIKVLVVACNTAAAHSSEQLKAHCPIPVIDVVESGARSISKATKLQSIAVLGTRGTIRSGVYEKEIHKLLPKATVISIACPLLVPLVEEHFLHHEAARLVVREYLAPLKSAHIDALLLGCTHYPLLRHLIEEELGPGIAIVDSSESCAERVASLLAEMELETTELNPPDRHQFFVSDDPERFSRTAKNFLADHIDIHVQVKIDDHTFKGIFLFLVYLCLCSRLGAEVAPIEFSFELLSHEHQIWTSSRSMPKLLADMDGQLVQIRGFIYPSQEGGWILASSPNLKSCCVGSENQAGAQIQVAWNNAPEITHSAVLAQGVFHINRENSHPYSLENASLVTQAHSSWPYYLLLIPIVLIGAIILGYSRSCNYLGKA